MNRFVFFVARSGSDYFSKKLSEKLGCEHHGEFANYEMQSWQQCNKYLQYLISLGSSDYVTKISSWQWQGLSQHTGTDVLDTVLNLADELYFLVRKDYNAQLKSFYAAMNLELQGISFTEEFTQQIVLRFRERQYAIHDQNLRARYQENARLYHDSTIKIPKHLVFYEDFQKPENRYNRNYRFDKQPYHVDFMPEDLFTESTNIQQSNLISN